MLLTPAGAAWDQDNALATRANGRLRYDLGSAWQRRAK